VDFGAVYALCSQIAASRDPREMPSRTSLPSITLYLGSVTLICCTVCVGQTNPTGTCKASTPDAQPKHILGIIPNHNTSPCLFPYVPISVKEKFKIASADAFDPGAIVAAAGAAGAAQLFNSNRPFGQEASGYGRYFGAAYANHVIGDFLREGVYPSLLHQDPRYFRKGSGSTNSRVGYAISRVFRTQTDAGGTEFNSSKILGAASTVAISSLYYANHRNAAGAAAGFGAQIGGAMAANILKSFGRICCEGFREGIQAAPPASPPRSRAKVK
jgi:hypothetical protein